MTIEKIKYFIEVARSSSITQAAQRLYVSQPNLSKQIAQMEAECGFALFSRSKHRLELTEAGERLYELLQDIPEQIEDAFSQAKEISLRNTRRLSIGVMELQGMNAILMPAIATFSKEYPHVDVNLERTGFGKLRAGLSSGIYDAIITLEFDAASTFSFEKMVLSEPKPVIAVHKNSPLARRNQVSLGELKNQNFVLIASKETPYGEQKFLKECERFGFQPNLVRRPSSLESLLLCVEAGIGIALLDDNIQLDSNTPVRLVPVHDIPPVAFYAAWSKKSENPLLPAFLGLLKDLH